MNLKSFGLSASTFYTSMVQCAALVFVFIAFQYGTYPPTVFGLNTKLLQMGIIVFGILGHQLKKYADKKLTKEQMMSKVFFVGCILLMVVMADMFM